MDHHQLLLARREIAAHPRVRNLQDTVLNEDGASIEFDIDMNFGDCWLADGHSPTGVLPAETVRFDFTPSFPIQSPVPSYRAALGRNLAHVMPGVTQDGRPVPCLVDGHPDEFYLSHGMGAFVDQFCDWLDRAAANALIDGEQGWEPMRRDRLLYGVILDRDQLRAFPTAKPNGLYLMAGRYWVSKVAEPFRDCYYEVTDFDDKTAFHPDEQEDKDHRSGTCPAIVLWGPDGDDEAVVEDVYAPDDISTIGELMGRAKSYGVGYRLRAEVQRISKGWKGLPKTFPLIVVFLVKRPIRLINSSSDIEIIPYLVQVTLGQKYPLDFAGPVIPLATRDRLGEQLLRRASGSAEVQTPWVMVGAGSLGSKIALHLGRNGNPPLAIVDSGSMQPHNAARHALYPSPYFTQDGWHFPKAMLLSTVVGNMNRTNVRPLVGNVNKMTPQFARLAERAGRLPVVINTTASLAAREFFAGRYMSSAPVYDAELFDGGRLGVLRVEGAGRNPDVGELLTGFYEYSLSNPVVEAALLASASETLAIGEGCSSETMICADSAISIHAALMAEKIDGLLRTSTASGGVTLWIRDGDGVRSEGFSMGAHIRLDAGNGWVLSIPPDLDQHMRRERDENLPRETGGILIGRISLASKAIYLARLMPAPADSRRKINYFELGVAGVLEARQEIFDRTKGRFVCVGTWHSHSGISEPSSLDRRTASELGAGKAVPQAVLILGSDGYHCITDFGFDTKAE